MVRVLFTVFYLLVLLTAKNAVYGQDEEDEYLYEDEEVEEHAFLLALKKTVEVEIPDGSNATVLLTIFNAGTRAAMDVEIIDQPMPPSITILGDSFDSIKIEKLNPGLSESFRIIIRPSQSGRFKLGPAKVTYSPVYNSKERQIVWSTQAAVSVLTTNEYLVSKILLMGSYATFGAIQTQTEWIRFGFLAGVLFLIFAMNYLWKKLSIARDERVRRKATEALEKEKEK